MYTYKVVIHPNNKQRTKILNTMNKCIECQNIVFDILSSYIQRKEKIPSCSDIRKLFTNIKKEKDIENINKRIGLTKKEQREKHLDVLFYDVSNDALKQMVKDTYNAFVRFFKKESKYPNRKTYKDNLHRFLCIYTRNLLGYNNRSTQHSYNGQARSGSSCGIRSNILRYDNVPLPIQFHWYGNAAVGICCTRRR